MLRPLHGHHTVDVLREIGILVDETEKLRPPNIIA